MSVFWELYQQKRIHEARSSAADSASASADAVVRVQELEDKLDRLALVCRALWSLLQETQGLGEEHLYQRVRELDLLDGQLDGRVRRTGRKCGQCQRVMSNRHNRCMYCGADALVETVFDTL
ncbi:MAG: hypothetical protein FJ125_02440 [Deltaproteobacteria bacterium]|nr:hypothetical protein [Deltaproteobacteria bacterium]